MITQVRRLGDTALRQIAKRFDELDAQSQEVLTALRNIDSQRNLIRSSRDGLYRLSRAWEPILQGWEASNELSGPALWQLIDRTYHFLAPRYMPVQEWQAFVAGQRRARPKPIGTVMTW
jgi:histidinol dehydrogenase